MKGSSLEQFTEWNFYGRNREKRLAVTRHLLFVEYPTYTRYEDLRADFIDAFRILSQEFKDVPVKRLGLRYVNEITTAGDNPLDGNGWFAPRIVAMLPSDYPEALTRAVATCEFKFDGVKVRHRFGIPNKDFPTVIRQRAFVRPRRLH